jgi:hypothetical protein
MRNHNPEQSNARHWPWWLFLTSFVAVVVFLLVVPVANLRQWARVEETLDRMSTAGGRFQQMEAHFWGGTPTAPDSRNRLHRALSWPSLSDLHVNRDANIQSVPWSRLPSVGTSEISIDHPEFSDTDLLLIPSRTPLTKIKLCSPLITNDSIAKLRQFRHLQEIDLIGTRIDRQGLLQIVSQTKWRLNISMTTADLLALRQAGALPRIGDFEIVANRDFNVSLLTGIGNGKKCIFRGKYDAMAFSGASAVLIGQQFVYFQEAELAPQNLTDIAGVTSLFGVFLIDCKIPSRLEKAAVAALRQRAPINKQFNISIRRTHLDPVLLRAFEGPHIHLYCNGSFADDEWLQDAMQIRGLKIVDLCQTQVSPAKIAQLESSTNPRVYFSQPRHRIDWMGFPLND